jgi:type IV pilus assembly protein PilE
MTLNTPRARSGGFSLIELIVVMGILAVLIKTAVPAYGEYMARGKRTDAKTSLQQASFFMERNQASTFLYDKDPSGAAVTDATLESKGLGQVPAHGEAAYKITFASGSPTAASYILLAQPQGGQAIIDSACGTLAMDHTGKRGLWVGGTILSNEDADQCWRR